MMGLKEFLAATKSNLSGLQSRLKIHVLIGDECCSLDHTISTITYAYFLHQTKAKPGTFYLPVINMQREQFKLKLETVSFLSKHNITAKELTFVSDVDLMTLSHNQILTLTVTLIDLTEFTESLECLRHFVVEVLRSPSGGLTDSLNSQDEERGPCSSIVAMKMLASDDYKWDPSVAELLLGTILVNTGNMSECENVLTPVDHEILVKLKSYLPPSVSATSIYEEIRSVKTDMSTLTLLEMLHKDSRVVKGNNITVAFAAVTKNIEDIISRPGFVMDSAEFCMAHHSDVLIIMASWKNTTGSLQRQIAIFSLNRIYREQISDVLLNSISPNLGLESINSFEHLENVFSFIQNNVHVLQKGVISLVQRFVADKTGTPDDKFASWDSLSSSSTQQTVNRSLFKEATLSSHSNMKHMNELQAREHKKKVLFFEDGVSREGDSLIFHNVAQSTCVDGGFDSLSSNHQLNKPMQFGSMNEVSEMGPGFGLFAWPLTVSQSDAFNGSSSNKNTHKSEFFSDVQHALVNDGVTTPFNSQNSCTQRDVDSQSRKNLPSLTSVEIKSKIKSKRSVLFKSQNIYCGDDSPDMTEDSLKDDNLDSQEIERFFILNASNHQVSKQSNNKTCQDGEYSTSLTDRQDQSGRHKENLGKQLSDNQNTLHEVQTFINLHSDIGKLSENQLTSAIVGHATGALVSHPTSALVSHATSAIVSHPTSAIVSHPASAILTPLKMETALLRDSTDDFFLNKIKNDVDDDDGLKTFTESHVEPALSESHVEPALSESHVEPALSESHVEPALSESHVEPALSESHVEPALSESHVEPALSESHVEPALSESHVEPALSEAGPLERTNDTNVKALNKEWSYDETAHSYAGIKDLFSQADSYRNCTIEDMAVFEVAKNIVGQSVATALKSAESLRETFRLADNTVPDGLVSDGDHSDTDHRQHSYECVGSLRPLERRKGKLQQEQQYHHYQHLSQQTQHSKGAKNITTCMFENNMLYVDLSCSSGLELEVSHLSGRPMNTATLSVKEQELGDLTLMEIASQLVNDLIHKALGHFLVDTSILNLEKKVNEEGSQEESVTEDICVGYSPIKIQMVGCDNVTFDSNDPSVLIGDLTLKSDCAFINEIEKQDDLLTVQVVRKPKLKCRKKMGVSFSDDFDKNKEDFVTAASTRSPHRSSLPGPLTSTDSPTFPSEDVHSRLSNENTKTTLSEKSISSSLSSSFCHEHQMKDVYISSIVDASISMNQQEDSGYHESSHQPPLFIPAVETMEKNMQAAVYLEEWDDGETAGTSGLGGGQLQLGCAPRIRIISDDEASVGDSVTEPTQLAESTTQLAESTSQLAESTSQLAESTSVDEQRWKRVLVSGSECVVDMHAVEPFKNVLSHGGYDGDGLGAAIIVFYGCNLPCRNQEDYTYIMDHLFYYVMHTLDEIATDEYVIIYFHGSTPTRQMPGLIWLKRCYQSIDRRLKKNLKCLLLVHPTFLLKTVVTMIKPFISFKFSSKLKYICNLKELKSVVAMNNISIPEAIVNYDRHQQQPSTASFIPPYICSSRKSL